MSVTVVYIREAILVLRNPHNTKIFSRPRLLKTCAIIRIQIKFSILFRT